MSSVGALIEELVAADIRLWTSDGRLYFDAREQINDTLLARIREHKPQLISYLVRHAKRGSPAARISADVARPPGDSPLSCAQQRLWLADQIVGAASAYNIAGSIRLRGELDPHALQAALDALVARHEVLRTTFHEIGGNPVQRSGSAAGFECTRVDLSCYDQTTRESETRRHIDEEAGQRFDLKAGPPIRGRLLRLTNRDHMLLVTMHHIVADGWSIAIFTRELAALYAAHCEGCPDPLPPLPLQYADYSIWQQATLAQNSSRDQLEYWKQVLHEPPTLLALPSDRVRPSVQSNRGANIEVVLDRDLTRRLRAFAQEHDVTLFMTLYAAFAMLLSRLSGQRDIVIGVPTANRSRVEVEALIGCFVNALAVRVQVRETDGVLEFLAQVKSALLGAYAHQHIPFEQVVEAVQPVRTLSHQPLFQTVLALRSTPPIELLLRELTLTVEETSNGTEKFDLTLSLQESDECIVGTLSYSTDLFDGATIGRWRQHFQTLLMEMLLDSRRTIRDLPMLTAEERREVLCAFNGAETIQPSVYSIVQLIERQAATRPAATAVVCHEGSLTYGELNAKANIVAHYLRSRGVGAERIVALCFERGAEMIIGMLGVLKAGGAYLPLDSQYPRERLSMVLKESGARIILTQERLKALLPLSAATAIALDSDWTVIEAHASDRDVTTADEDVSRRLAYVIYTSGSTGAPKGVMVEHANLLNLVTWHCSEFDLQPGEGSSCVAGFGFDACTWEVWPPLCTGGILALPSEEMAREPGALLQWWRASELQISFLATPLAELAFASGIRNHNLRALLVGGDCLRHRPENFGRTALVNNYGPTECTVVATSGRIQTTDPKLHIGRPIWNTRIYILDGNAQPVPIGVHGEIYIGGSGVARGYLNRPDLTAERFLADPFSANSAARMYRTGDIGRWRNDGNIEYIGRADSQVKIRGYRIELGEVEAQLLRHPQVKEAIVLTTDDHTGTLRLVAYATCADWQSPTPASLRAHLQQALPEYMVPNAYVLLAALPLTPNGKVDRRALSALQATTFEMRSYEEPTGTFEVRLAQIWKELFRIERVSRNDNFYELGGHSLMAMQLLSRIRKEFGRELPLRTLFECQTILSLAGHIASSEVAVDTTMSRADRSRPLPLSFAQQRMWLIERMGRGGEAYHIPGLIRLRGRLNRIALQQTLQTVIERHEILRTVIESIDGHPFQTILETPQFALHEIDIDGASHESRESELLTVAIESARMPFDLEVGPLIRVCLAKLSECDHVLLITMHHIVADGWSIGILSREMAALYAAYSGAQPNPLPALAIQYADYAAWQRETLRDDVLRSHLGFWKEHLMSAPRLLELPTDRPRPPAQSFRAGCVDVFLCANVSRKLKALARQHDATLFMVLYAGFAILLSRLSGQRDVVIGTSVANRQRVEDEGLIGCFVNNLALRVEFAEEMSVSALLDNVKTIALAAFAHQDAPFDQVVSLIQPKRASGYSPLFQAFLVLQNTPQEELHLADLTVTLEKVPNNVEKFDLTASLVEMGDQIIGSFSFASDLFDRTTIERWTEYFKAVLAGMASDPCKHVSAIDLLSDEERRMLQEFNSTDVRYLQ